jgi:hypothetical protein
VHRPVLFLVCRQAKDRVGLPVLLLPVVRPPVVRPVLLPVLAEALFIL